MRFREHRGNLYDSLKTTIEIKDKQELYEILREDLNHFYFDFSIDDMQCIPQGFDRRCGWDTYLITIKNFGVIGMTDGKL